MYKQYGGMSSTQLPALSVNSLTVNKFTLTGSVNGAFNVVGSLGVDGVSTFDGDVIALQNSEVKGDLTVGGRVYFVNDTVNDGNLSITGLIDMNNAATIYGDSNTNNLGINTLEPKSSLHIVGTNESVLRAESTKPNTLNVLAQASGGQAVGIGAGNNTDHTGDILFYSNVDQPADASIAYSSVNESLTLQANNTVNVQTKMSIDGSASSASSETASLEIISRAPEDFFPNTYDDIQNFHGLAVHSQNETSLAEIALTTPLDKGLVLRGGIFGDTNRAMGHVSLANIVSPSMVLVEGTNETRIPSSIGLNTFLPSYENYALDVNGPTRVTHTKITNTCSSELECYATAFSNDGMTGIIVGNSNGFNYPFYKTYNGGRDWESGNILLAVDNISFRCAMLGPKNNQNQYSIVLGGTQSTVVCSPDFGITWNAVPVLDVPQSSNSPTICDIVSCDMGTDTTSAMQIAIVVKQLQPTSKNDFVVRFVLDATVSAESGSVNSSTNSSLADNYLLLDKLYFNTAENKLFCLGNSRVFEYATSTLTEMGTNDMITEYDRLIAWTIILQGGLSANLPASVGAELTGLLSWTSVVTIESTGEASAVATGSDGTNTRLFLLANDQEWKAVDIDTMNVGGNSKQWNTSVPRAIVSVQGKDSGYFLAVGGTNHQFGILLYLPTLVKEHVVLKTDGATVFNGNVFINVLKSYPDSSTVSLFNNTSVSNILVGTENEALTTIGTLAVAGNTTLNDTVTNTLKVEDTIETSTITSSTDGEIMIRSLNGGGLVYLGANGDEVIIAGGGSLSSETASFGNVVVTSNFVATQGNVSLGETIVNGSLAVSEYTFLNTLSIANNISSSIQFGEATSECRAAGIDYTLPVSNPLNTDDLGTLALRARAIHVGTADQFGTVQVNGSTAFKGSVDVEVGKFITMW